MRAVGQPIRPTSLNLAFRYLPSVVSVYYWRRFFSREIAEFIFARHARSASAEVKMLATDCRVLLEKTAISAPTLNRLYRAIEDWTDISDYTIHGSGPGL